MAEEFLVQRSGPDDTTAGLWAAEELARLGDRRGFDPNDAGCQAMANAVNLPMLLAGAR